MGQLAQTEGHGATGLIAKLAPGEAAVVDDVVIGFDSAVLQPVIAHALPHVFDWVGSGHRSSASMFSACSRSTAWLLALMKSAGWLSNHAIARQPPLGLTGL